MREVATAQPDRRTSTLRRDDVLRMTLAAGTAGYRASLRHVPESRFGDERELAIDIPFKLPQRDLLTLRGDRAGYGRLLTEAFFGDPRLYAAWQKVHYLSEGTGRRLQVRIEIESSAAE
jgi:hypothetical protein